MNQKNINAMRSLSLNAIKKAGQGHTGMAISAAPITYTLFTKFININKNEPKWINRDRFVLSAGHGSMSLYSVLHFAGLLTIDDIKKHKTKNSKTPGHPEYEKNNYIDASTGPLGQGIAMGVGMAIAQESLSNKFKKINKLIDHYTYVLVGDGCLQEGISYESMSIAGKLKLSKLIVLHDSNNYQIDSNVNATFTENLEKRTTAMNWAYEKCSNDPIAIQKAIENAQKNNQPSFIEIKTIIGEGTSASNTRFAHGLKVDNKEEQMFQEYFNINFQEFIFEKSIYEYFEKNVIERGEKKFNEWQELYKNYSKKYFEEIKLFNDFIQNKFPKIDKLIDYKKLDNQARATRDYIKEYFKQISDQVQTKWFLVGSADLASATNVAVDINKSFADDKANTDIIYGIREFAMGAIQNGILLHGGLKTIASTFLVFSDYMKSALRLGALNNLPAAYIFTHDSYQVGGDGPTHQPFDQLPMLRAISNLFVYRPCDAIESKYVFEKLFNSVKGTQVGIFTRQPLKSIHPTSISKSKKGGYILYDEKNPDLTLVGAGSEIDLLFEVRQALKTKKINAKIVSVPCLSVFLENDEDYLQATLGSKNGIFATEPSSDYMWYKMYKYGKKFAFLGGYTFGESMDGQQVYVEKGFNVDNILKILKTNKLI